MNTFRQIEVYRAADLYLHLSPYSVTPFLGLSRSPAMGVANPQIVLLPWDPESPEHVDRLYQQRIACGWNKQAVEGWRELQRAGKIALHWVVNFPFPHPPYVTYSCSRSSLRRIHLVKLSSAFTPLPGLLKPLQSQTAVLTLVASHAPPTQ